VKKPDPELATPTIIMGACFVLIGLFEFVVVATRPDVGVVACLAGGFILWYGIRMRMQAKNNGGNGKTKRHE
jgi:hypothetical protein